MLLSALAGGMLVPAFTEILLDQPDWPVFITAALITGFIAGALVLTNRASCRLYPSGRLFADQRRVACANGLCRAALCF